jgi:hypothetical protein
MPLSELAVLRIQVLEGNAAEINYKKYNSVPELDFELFEDKIISNCSFL